MTQALRRKFQASCDVCNDELALKPIQLHTDFFPMMQSCWYTLGNLPIILIQKCQVPTNKGACSTDSHFNGKETAGWKYPCPSLVI